MNIDLVSAEWSCAKAIYKYAKGADNNDAAIFLDAFTSDGVWVRPDGQELKGHAELSVFFLARPSGVFSRHVITNVVVDIVDSGNAIATSVGMVLKAKAQASQPFKFPPATTLAYYEDRLRRCGDGHWRLLHRRVTVQMELAAGTASAP